MLEKQAFQLGGHAIFPTTSFALQCMSIFFLFWKNITLCALSEKNFADDGLFQRLLVIHQWWTNSRSSTAVTEGLRPTALVTVAQVWGQSYCRRSYRLIPKICEGAKYQNRHSSKSIWVMKLFFCQNSPLMGQLFWQKNSFITHILFELCLFWYLAQSK